jgi:hypothetical protein
MQTDKTHINVELNNSWEKPTIEEIGNAADLIKEAKFSGFSDGVTFAGSPIGEST